MNEMDYILFVKDSPYFRKQAYKITNQKKRNIRIR